jgi:hypothetical protein
MVGGRGGGGWGLCIHNWQPSPFVCKQSLSFTHDDAALVSRYTFFFPLLWEEDEDQQCASIWRRAV